jgi:hypothetical protein
LALPVPTVIAQAFFRPDLASAQDALRHAKPGSSGDVLSPERSAPGVAS